MAPTGGGVSAPGTKSKGKNKTKSVRHLLAPSVATASPSPAPGTDSSPSVLRIDPLARLPPGIFLPPVQACTFVEAQQILGGLLVLLFDFS